MPILKPRATAPPIKPHLLRSTRKTARTANKCSTLFLGLIQCLPKLPEPDAQGLGGLPVVLAQLPQRAEGLALAAAANQAGGVAFCAAGGTKVRRRLILGVGIEGCFDVHGGHFIRSGRLRLIRGVYVFARSAYYTKSV